MFMNSPCRRATILAGVLIGLVVTFASGQTRPSAAPTAEASDARARIAKKVDELSKRIEAQVEAARVKQKAAAALAMLEDVTGGAETPLSKLEAAVPSLKNDHYVLNQYQYGLQAMAGRLGSENPKYKALATQMEAMRKAYQKNLVALRQRYASGLAEARREAVSAKSSLDEATAQVAAAQRELVDLAITVGR